MKVPLPLLAACTDGVPGYAAPLPAVGAHLTTFPEDVLGHVVVRLRPQEVVRLGQACYSLYAFAASDSLWRTMFGAHFDAIVTHAFGGICPPPRAPLSWRAHFFQFSNTWMLRAKDEGRLLMTIHGHVYDVTDFAEHHPGMPAFLHSAAGTDASVAFALAGHSQNARRFLRELAVPALDPHQPRARGSGGGGGGGGGGSSRGRSSVAVDGAGASLGDASHVATSTRGAAAGHAAGSSSTTASRLHCIHRVVGVLSVLLRSAHGRRKLLDSLGSLLSAGLVDLERTGRDPVERHAPADAPKTALDAGIQRLLPVAWHLSCVELADLSRQLQASTPPTLLVSRGDPG